MRLFLVINSKNIGAFYKCWKELSNSVKQVKKKEPDGSLRIYLSGLEGRKKLLIDTLQWFEEREDLNIHLSGTGLWRYTLDNKRHLTVTGISNLYILESFAYIDADDILIPLIPYFKGFMLDSGAFTFLQQQKQKGTTVDFDSYLRKYIDFINTHQIEQFFELDVDSLVGYEKVKEYRRTLEQQTGKQCIPVWHKGRGKTEFLRMCDEYPYVALGGIAIQEIRRSEHHVFSWFIREAHKRGARIHGLGYTNLKGLERYHFDSVDSSSWTSGNRFGHIYRFNGRTLVKYDKPPGMRVKPVETAINNFTEWAKFARYAEKNL